jgi:starch phosphorylase
VHEVASPGISHLPYGLLPRGIEGFDSLVELALDLRWSWNHAADSVWRQLDPALWELTQNPWGLLQTVSRKRIEQRLADPTFRRSVEELLKIRRQRRAPPGFSIRIRNHSCGVSHTSVWNSC